MGKCELIGEMEGKLRQHFLQHKWLSRCWRNIASVPWPRRASLLVTAPGNEPACCWRPALRLREAPCRGPGVPARWLWDTLPALLAGSPNVGDPVSPAVSETQKQTWENLVSRHNFTIIDIINIKPNKPFCALPRWERCRQDARVEARAEFLSAVVIATGAVVYRQQLCNSRLHLEKCNSLHKASQQQRRQKTHGHGRGGRLSGTA